MRTRIISFLSIFIFVLFVQRITADEGPVKITRISLSASDKIEYESRFLNNPPRLIIRFKNAGVVGKLTEDSEITRGAIKNTTVTYYPLKAADTPDTRRIKFLTFWLNEGASYKIRDTGNKIFLDFKSASPSEESGGMLISSLTNLKGAAPKHIAASALLSRFEGMHEPVETRRSGSDMPWIAATVLIMVYIMWFRPEAWKRMLDRFTGADVMPAPSKEQRRWWRHSLLPLKNRGIYVNIHSHDTDTKLELVPRDIGYGGFCFEYNRTKTLKGELDIKIFSPDRVLPVEVKGNVAWQKNSWNFLRRRVGVSFVDPPEKSWAGIHQYIEEQYASLKS